MVKEPQKDTGLVELNFQSLIQPIEDFLFFAKNWEKEPLIISRKNRDFYKPLFSIDEVDRVLKYARPNGRDLKVVKNQVPLLPAKYENQDGSLNLNQLYVSYVDGYTIVINEIQRFHQAIQELCTAIRQQLSHHVVANMYLTPPNQKALLPHYDTHDVLVLQIHGKKHWHIYDAPVETPLLHSFQPIFQPAQLTGKKEVTLEAGDFMYMPRGVPHDAYTNDESSLHITIGIHPAQWVDFFTNAFKQVALNNVNFRKALPPGFMDTANFDEDTMEVFKGHFQQLLGEFQQQFTPAGAIQLLKLDFDKKSTTSATGHFAQIDKMQSLTLESKVKIRQGLDAEVYIAGNIARIKFPGNMIKGPAHITEALQFIAANGAGFQLSAMPAISDKNKVKLIQRLIRGGLLEIVE